MVSPAGAETGQREIWWKGGCKLHMAIQPEGMEMRYLENARLCLYRKAGLSACLVAALKHLTRLAFLRKRDRPLPGRYDAGK